MGYRRPHRLHEGDFLVLHAIRLGTGNILSPGEVIEWARFHPRRLRRWMRRKWIGPVGHQWTELTAERLGVEMKKKKKRDGRKAAEVKDPEAPAEGSAEVEDAEV